MFAKKNIAKLLRNRLLLLGLHGTVAFSATPQSQTLDLPITESPYTTIIKVNGTLDGRNTYKHSYNIDVEQSFEVMRTLSMTNTGITKIRAPRLVINNERGVYDFSSMIDRILADTHTAKEEALALWHYFRDHRVHHRSPESGSNIADPINLLGIYGYLTCGSASKLLSGIGKKLGFSAHAINMAFDGDQHSVAEINFGDRPVILDMDAQVFYLDYDNQTLIGKKEISDDNFLIRRTHHFGKNRMSSFDVAPLYNAASQTVDAGIFPDRTLDIDLRPGESFVYDWAPARVFHHLIPTVPNPIPWMVSNSRFEYSPNFKSAALEDLFESVSNVRIEKSANNSFIHPESPGQNAAIIISVRSPYTIVDGTIHVDAQRATEQDIITCDYSPNNRNWTPLWEGTNLGENSTDIPLYKIINTMARPELHTYYIRISMKSESQAANCRLDSLSIKTICQTSRYNMPQLQLGSNTLYYSDQTSHRSLNLSIEWQESAENSPPRKIIEPIYPENGGICENSQFSFLWQQGQDDDGDAIIDYEFQLSDRKDMRFPLSPTFDRYIRLLSDPLKPEFSIPHAGLLNDGVTYYWRVRSWDAHGAWSEWSGTWSFTVHTVMMPENVFIAEQNTMSNLFWQPNEFGIEPNYFEVHGSHTKNGFTPDEDTKIAETFDLSYDVSALDYTFYRVIAYDDIGRASGPSRLANINSSSVDSPDATPKLFALKQNYPNPFNSQTHIKYVLNQNTPVTLTIYNALGQNIATLVDEYQQAGSHDVQFQADQLPSGIYLYILRSGDKKFTRKMTLIR
jgi:hypothetical protein